MLSRVAENLYWTGRYIERAEHVARLLDDAFHFELDAAVLGEATGEGGPVEGVLLIQECRDAFPQTSAGLDRDSVLRFLTFDRGNPKSILAMIAAARENARGTQEAISSEAWSQLNRLYLHLARPYARRRFQTSPYRFYDSIKRACILFGALLDTTLPRAEAYHFLQAGRYLERVDMVARILQIKLQPWSTGLVAYLALPAVYWTGLLRCCSAYEAYLKAYQDHLEPHGVVRFLVLNADFPRAIRFGVACCLQSLHDLAAGEPVPTEAERLLGRLDGQLRYMDAAEIFGQGVGRFFQGIKETCNRVGDGIGQAYFLH